MRFSKKAQQNMFWIVIGAVIALVVMIILIVMFTGKTGTLEGGLLDCESKGGDCSYSSSESCKEAGGTVTSAFSCSGEDIDNICCFVSDEEE